MAPQQPLFFFFLLLLSPLVSAIYESQYGVNEWHSEYVGEVEKMAAGPLDKTVFLLSKTHLASVRPETGELVWRRQLPAGFDKPRLLVSFKHRVISVVEGEGAMFVSVWDAAEGSLWWDKVLLKSSGNQHGDVLEKEVDLMVWSNFKFLFLLRFDDGVHTFAHDGEFGWTWQPPKDSSIVKVLRTGEQTLCVTKKDNQNSPNNQITYQVVSLDSANGRVMHTTDPIVTAPSPGRLAFTEESFFVVHTPSSSSSSSSSPSLSAFPLKTTEPPTLLPLSSLFPSPSPTPRIVSFTRVWPYSIIILEQKQSSQHFLYSAVLHYPSLDSGNPSTMEVVWSFQTTHPLSFSSSSTGVVGWDEERPKEKEGKRLHEMYILTIDKESLYASSSSVVAGGKVTTRKILALAPTPAHLDKFQIFQDKFILGLAEDNTLFGFDLSSSQTDPLPTPCIWVREESLAGIVHTAFSDFPSKRRPEARDMGEFFLEYTSYLYQNLQDILSQDQQEFWDMADQVKESLVDGTWSMDTLKTYNFYSHLPPLFTNKDNHHHNNKPFSDTYGFNKVILVTTTSGKLHALSSQTGSPLWSHYAGPSVSFSSLITYRPAHHHPTHATVAYVDDTTSSSSVLTVDAFTGELISLIHVDYPIQSVELLTLPSSSSSSSSPDSPPTFVSIDKSGAMRPWPPSNPLSTASLKQHSSALFLHRVQEDDVAIVGYRYEWEEKEEVLVPKEAWRVVLGTPGVEKFENVLTSVAGHVNLHGNVPPSYFVGDMEYSPYTNPNVVYAVTGVVSGGEAQEKKGAAISVYAIDGVTGNIIYQTFHQQAGGPVHMVRDENWLCYHFWNSKLNRNELTMLELVSPPPNPTRPAVIGLLQTFILDFDVQGMGVSKTLYGATSKDILFTSGGMVLGLVRSYLSPRRPAAENFTQAHREQMIVPYQPQLLLFPQHFLSANRTIFGANSVATAPSHMESSSLVFVSGHDTFFTVVTPSKAFDLLESDFNYFGLVLTVLGALVLVLVFRWLALAKELNAQWK